MLVIAAFSSRSNVAAFTKPMSIFDTLPFCILTTSVIAAFLVFPSWSTCVVNASELTPESTPAFWYVATVYLTVS